MRNRARELENAARGARSGWFEDWQTSGAASAGAVFARVAPLLDTVRDWLEAHELRSTHTAIHQRSPSFDDGWIGWRRAQGVGPFRFLVSVDLALPTGSAGALDSASR